MRAEAPKNRMVTSSVSACFCAYEWILPDGERKPKPSSRNALRVRAVSAAGPPPYANCIPGRPGLQFVGVVPGGATRRWFTYNWPATWHVVWTIMPLTTCSGAAQLTWKTQVERASATKVTYWIVVTNLTSSAVRFEGRYDILSR